MFRGNNFAHLQEHTI